MALNNPNKTYWLYNLSNKFDQVVIHLKQTYKVLLLNSETGHKSIFYYYNLTSYSQPIKYSPYLYLYTVVNFSLCVSLFSSFVIFSFTQYSLFLLSVPLLMQIKFILLLLFTRYLDRAVSRNSGIRKQDAAAVFSAVSSNVIGQPLAFGFIRDQWRRVKD